jgi:hypothetical protein
MDRRYREAEMRLLRSAIAELHDFQGPWLEFGHGTHMPQQLKLAVKEASSAACSHQ